MTWRRFLRALVGVVVAGTAAEYGDNIMYLSLSPMIAAAGKFLRVKFPGLSWLPF